MLKCRKCGKLEENGKERFRRHICSICINEKIDRRNDVIKKMERLSKNSRFF